MSLIQIVPPIDPVVPLDELKALLRVDTSADDAMLRAIGEAAAQRLDGPDGILGRCLRPQQWLYSVASWPVDRVVIPLSPVISIDAVTYLDTDAAEQTLAIDQYRVIAGGTGYSCIGRATGITWPPVLDGQPDGVRVLFTAGYVSTYSPAEDAVPPPVRLAVALMAQSMYDRPGQEDLPEAAASLISPYRINRLSVFYRS